MARSIFRKSLVLSCTLFASGALATPAAHAQFFHNSTGLASPTATITFEEVTLPELTPVTNQYAAYGATFADLYSTRNISPFPHYSGTALRNYDQNSRVNRTISIFFNTPQTSAAFVFVSNPATSVFTALNNGVVVATGTESTNVDSPDNYYGFTGVTFDQIQVTPVSYNNAAGIDNLQIGSNVTAVPEPSEYAAAGMFGAVLLLGMVKARRKASTGKKATASV